MTCLQIFWAVYHAESTNSPQLSIPRAVAPAFVLAYLLAAITILHDDIVRSAQILQSARSKFVDQEFRFLDVSDDSSAQRIESTVPDVRMKSPSPPLVANTSTAEAVSVKPLFNPIF